MAYPAKGQSIPELVTNDLGYCCVYFFFTRYRKTALIAARLGVTDRAVRYVKARVRDGESKCTECERCLLKQMRTPNSTKLKQVAE
jgi:hypothetical protein